MGKRLEAELFKKYSSDMIAAIRYPIDIAGKLYSSGIIDGSTRDRVQMSDNGANDLIIAVETFILSQPVLGKRSGMSKKFKEILEIFKEFIPLNYIVKALEDEYEQVISSKEENDNDAVETPSKKKYKTDTDDDEQDESVHYNIFTDPHLSQLAGALQVYSNDFNESGLAPEAVLLLVKARIETHIKKKSKEGLSKDDVTKHISNLTMNALIPMDITGWCYEKLDNVYADLEQELLNISDSSSSEDDCSANPVNHQPSLHSLQPLSECGHTFDKISFSIASSTDRILVAQQGDIMYISFSSSDICIHERLPIRYFCELLHQGKRLIFTGFAKNGIAAYEVLQSLWSSALFSQDILVQNTACITFGIASISLSSTRNEDIESSLFCFLLEEDMSDENLEHELIYQQCVYSESKNYLIKEYNGVTFYENIKISGPGYPLLPGTMLLLLPDISTMQDYHLKVLRGYLDKAPHYTTPPRQDMSSIKGVQSLFPSISNVELHQHKHPEGYELAFVINGDNLWFCNEVQLKIEEEYFKITTSPENVSQKQISYNYIIQDYMTNIHESDVQIEVISTFAQLPLTSIPMSYSEPDPISFRQSQLAKQTPSQIIQLSFLSALLEQSPSVQADRPTKRFELIVKFLQEAARIVPMESITSAIASSKNTVIAARCAQAFLSIAHTSSIPVSKLMMLGCREAWLSLYHHKANNISVHDFIEMQRLHSLHYPNFDRSYRNRYSIKQQREKNYELRGHVAFSKPVSQSMTLTLTKFEENQLLCHFDEQIIFNYFNNFLFEFYGLPACHLICGRNIGEAYPISKSLSSASTSICSAFKPLPEVLRKARIDLAKYSITYKDTELGSESSRNSDMLEKVNSIIANDLQPCVAMLGGFMEQQIHVPLLNNPQDTAKAFRTADKSGALGVWALFALSGEDIKRVLQSSRNQTVVIRIAKFIEGVFSKDIKKHEIDEQTTSYIAKLQFLLQVMRPTITCSSQYISYSLERELVDICKERNITTSTSIDTIMSDWDSKFESTALVLVPHQYRPLLARWLIWALNIHQLRESLASYTTVGVIGLVNSGKSTLVNKVFKIETVQGTTQAARTTVPLIYNLDNEVEGLSVIDFPGVDDRDDTIGGLAELLVGLAQIVIFVCEYKRFHTKSAKEWMEIFEKDFESAPILVLLTNADKLYGEKCDKDMVPECPERKIPIVKALFEEELKKIIGQKPLPRNCTVKLCSLAQDQFSLLNDERSRKFMRKIGIYASQDVGDWIKRALEANIQQKDLADKLGRFLVEQK